MAWTVAANALPKLGEMLMLPWAALPLWNRETQVPTLVKCSNCSATMKVPTKYAGKVIHCLNCKSAINAPPAVESTSKPEITIATEAAKPSSTDGANPEVQDANRGQSNTRLFLARRGCMIMRERRDHFTLHADHSKKVLFETIVVSTVKGTTKEVSHGLHIQEIERNDELNDEAYIDFDEIDELIYAILFILEVQKDMLNRAKDNTEIEYRTKDNCRIGFFQVGLEQCGFLDASDGKAIFFPIKMYASIISALKGAKEYLITKGAKDTSA